MGLRQGIDSGPGPDPGPDPDPGPGRILQLVKGDLFSSTQIAFFVVISYMQSSQTRLLLMYLLYSHEYIMRSVFAHDLFITHPILYAYFFY